MSIHLLIVTEVHSMRCLSISLLITLTTVYLYSQTQVSLGITGTLGAACVSTSKLRVSDCPQCGIYGTGNGSSESIAFEGYLRHSADSRLRFISLLGVSKLNARSSWQKRSEPTPSTDQNGNVLMTINGFELSNNSTSTGFALGAGIEWGSLSLIPMIRASMVSNASTVSRFVIYEPRDAVLSPWPGFETEDGGRARVLERIQTSGHTSTMIDGGVLLGYTFLFNLAGANVETALQAYALRGLTPIHRNYSTTVSIEAGGRVFLGIRL